LKIESEEKWGNALNSLAKIQDQLAALAPRLHTSEITKSTFPLYSEFVSTTCTIYLSLKTIIKSAIPVKKRKKPIAQMEQTKKMWQEISTAYSNFTAELKACVER
jgi:hypothetical protein